VTLWRGKNARELSTRFDSGDQKRLRRVSEPVGVRPVAWAASPYLPFLFGETGGTTFLKEGVTEEKANEAIPSLRGSDITDADKRWIEASFGLAAARMLDEVNGFATRCSS